MKKLISQIGSALAKGATFALALGAFAASSFAADVQFNEIVSSNDADSAPSGKTVVDENGRDCDWIELRNMTPNAINLTDWGLSDKSKDLFKCKLPEVTISQNSCLILYCTGSNYVKTVGSTTYCHVDLSISSDGETLTLTKKGSTTAMDTVEFGYIPCNCSYGRISNGLNWGYFSSSNVTPGASNGSTSYTKLLKPVKFSPERKVLTSDQTFTVTLTQPDNADIYYTTDCSEPTTSSTKYTGTPISVSGTKIIRARAFSNSNTGSCLSYHSIQTHSYIYLNTVGTYDWVSGQSGYPSTWNAGSTPNGNTDKGATPTYKPKQDLSSSSALQSMIESLQSAPIVSLTVNRKDMFGSNGIYPNPISKDGTKLNCSVEWVTGPDTNLIFGVEAQVSIAGGGSRLFSSSPKKSLKVKFSKTLGTSKLDKPIFQDNGYEDTGFKTIQFRAEHNQSFATSASNKNGDGRIVPGTYIKDQFFRDVQGKLSGYTLPGSWVHLFIDGLYWGVYNPTERGDAGAGSRHFDGEKDDYVALKPDCLTSGAPVTRDDDGASGSRNIRYYMAAICKKSSMTYSLPTNMSVKANYDICAKNFDLAALADYMNISYWSGNNDWPWNNWVMIGSPKNNVPFRFYSWDAESAWQNVSDSVCGDNSVGRFTNSSRSWNYYDGAQTHGPQMVQFALQKSPEYRLLFADRVHEAFKSGGVCSSANVLAEIQKQAKKVRKLLFAESARWRSQSVVGDWDTGMNMLTNKWSGSASSSGLSLRKSAHLSSLKKYGLYPSFETPDWVVSGDKKSATLSVPSGTTVYYTTDGSDPRVAYTGTIQTTWEGSAVYGDVSSTAKTYSGAVTASAKTTLKARARKSDGSWSFLTTAELEATTQSGVKMWGIAGYPPSGDDGIGEFLILTNTSSSTAKDLNGYTIKIWKEADGESAAKCKFTISGSQTIAAKGYFRIDNNPKKWDKITNNQIGFAIYDASGVKVDSGSLSQKDIGAYNNGNYAVRNFANDTWTAKPISSAPGGQEIEPSPASAFTLSGNKSASILDLYTKTNATLTLSGLTGSNFAVRVHSLPGAVTPLTLTMKYSGSVTNRIDIDKNSDNVPFLDAPDFNLVIKGTGGAKITSTKKLDNSGILRAKDLTVESGYTSVEFDNNKDGTACVYLTGNFWQKDGDFRVKMAKGYTNEFYGVRLASDNTWAKIDNGNFKATVGGLMSAGIKVKKTCNVYFNGGEIDGDIKGGCARFVDGGTLAIAGGDVSVNFDGDLTATNAAGQITTEALQKLASCTNARVFKVDNDINITGGKVKVDLDALEYNQFGARAFSADGNLNISGTSTIVNLKTGDDCVDVAGNITISNGKVYAKSYLGHGLDATGSVTISGGLVLAYSFGDNAIAIDGASVAINGGKVVALGGAGTTSAVTSPSGSAPLYRAANLVTANYKDKYMTLQGANMGNQTPKTTVQIPTLTGANFSILATVPGMTSGAKPTWSASAPAEGSIDFHNVYEYTGPYVEPGAAIVKPTIPAKVPFDGTDKKPNLSVTGVSFTYNPTTAWIQPGEYTVTCKLTDKTKYTWDDGTTSDLTLTMEIVMGDPDLPTGYTRLEYVESGSGQYVDTGYKAQNGLSADIVFEMKSISSANNNIVLGAYASGAEAYIVNVNKSGKWSASLGSETRAESGSVATGTKYTVNSTISSGNTITLKVNGSQVVSKAYSAAGTASYNLYLLARNYNNAGDNSAAAKLYSAVLKVNGSEVRNYIPCKSDTLKIGLYDKISGNFYESANGTAFVAGPEVTPTPVEPTKVTPPTAVTGIVYDGTPKTGVAAGTNYTVTDGTKTDAGSYTAVAKLKNTTDYIWSDNTTADKSFAWSIAAAANDWMVSPSISKTEWTTSDAAGTLTAAKAKFGTVSATIAKDGGAASAFSGTLPSAVGSYVITYTLATSSNWTNPATTAKTVAFTIKQGTTPPTPVGRLPAGYTEYDSVTATGSQYIDTGVHAQNGLVTELTMTVNEVTSSALVLGAYASNAEAYYGYMNGSNWAFGIGQSGERDKPTAAIQTNKKLTMVLNQSAATDKAAKLLVTVDGTKISEKEYSSPATTANMYLFARNDTSTPKVDKNVKVTVYSLKFTLNGSALREFVPCQNDQNEVGFYDLVSKEFFASEGGALVPGEIVNPPTPVEPTKVTPPTAVTGLVYDGTPKTGVASGTGYTVTNGAKTDAGSYTATAKLANTTEYIWSDSTTADKSIAWSIAAAANDWTVSPAISKSEWTQGDAAGTLTAAQAKFGTVSATIAKDGAAASAFSGTLPTEAGSYVIAYTLATSSNWTNPSVATKTVAFTIKQGTPPPTPVGRLPAGYTEYDSVTATGSQYIDTGVHAQNGLVTELTMTVNEVTSSALVLGAYASNAEAYYGYMNGSNWAFGIGQSGERDKPTAAIQTNKKLTMVLNQSAATDKAAKLLVTVDGTKISEKEYSSPATTANMYLFARNDTSTPKVDKNVKVTVYSLKFTLNGSPLREFVPCKNDQNEVGFYDLVSKEFFAPKGGALVPGEIVTPVDPDPSANPTIGGKEVDPAHIFSDPDNAARSDRPITYPDATQLRITGAEGSQKIEYANSVVEVPACYTAVQNGNTVSLELNDNAAPTIAATEEGPAVEIKDGAFIVRFAPNEKAKDVTLYYALARSESLTPMSFERVTDWTQAELSIPMGGKATGFFKVLVTDVPPAQK